MRRRGWYGFDLDGTLAFYDGWAGSEHVGAPVPRMLAQLLLHLKEGYECRIVTARVGKMPGRSPADIEQARTLIQNWCLEHIGRKLVVTNEKDFEMIALYDDRVVQIQPNSCH